MHLPGGTIMKRLYLHQAIIVVLIMARITIHEGRLAAQPTDYFKAIPTSLTSLKDNDLTPEKVSLGKMLYFDPRLSSSGLISCNTCHNLSVSGDDNLPTSIGHGWAKGPRNAPTVYNAVFNVAQFWDGRAKDLEEQAKGPVQAAVEMNSNPDLVIRTLKSMPKYVELFTAAYPGQTDPVTFSNMANAIEAFEATLLTPGSRFDEFLGGYENALTENEKKGLQLFIDNACVSCHAGINIGGEGYYAFGVFERPGAEILPPGDRGRYAVTETVSDEYVFRAGPLRNIAITAPYFHSGQVWDMKQAVTIMGNSQLGLAISDDEAQLITEFLGTLTGKRPVIDLPLLPTREDGTPKPQP
jgi:cytochrome c peroxidase